MSEASAFDSSILPNDVSPLRECKSNAEAENIFYILRAANGFSTKELARRAGTSPMTTNRLERGYEHLTPAEFCARYGGEAV